MKQKYDVVVIGSGLGGLVSALILAKEGYRVCVLEKNNQFGGNLQTFVRDKTIFDTGIHYIGGLDKGENLYRYFSYLGIMDDLNLKRMDLDGFDVVSFGDDDVAYPHAQGYEHFVNQLALHFPEERENIEAYCKKVREICDSFPLYNLEPRGRYEESLLELNARDCIDSITTNPKLREVLAGTNFLYAGIADKTPFYVHALAVNSYIQSSWRCVNGGSQITKQLIKQLKIHHGETYKYCEVTSARVSDNRIQSVVLADGTQIQADLFFSNIELKTALNIIGPQHFRKIFYERIQNLESSMSAFSLYIVFKPECFAYENRNFYHFSKSGTVWKAHDYNEENWPMAYMASQNVSHKTDKFAEGMTFITYMRFDEVAPWEHTFNTTAKKNDRGESYEEFKARKTETFLKFIEQKFPGIRNCIRSIHTSTPLSYRDYIGAHRGNMYGYVKDSAYPMKTMIPAKTRLENLYLTGQSVSMHGVLGVTIGAVLACAEILGKEYLVNKIRQS